jgi:hypothetical protein
VGPRNGLDAVEKRHISDPPPHQIKPWFLDSPARSLIAILICRISQEERSIFWEATVLVIISKKKKVCMYMCHIPKVSR